MKAIRLLLLLSHVFVAGCISYSGPALVTFGESRSEAHGVSFEELFGNSDFFHGQPVRLAGVADFRFGFEERSRLFASREAFVQRTYSYVSVAFSESWIERYGAELEKLEGTYVVIEGRFNFEPRTRINEDDDEIQICFPDCGTYFLYDINRVGQWEY